MANTALSFIRPTSSDELTKAKGESIVAALNELIGDSICKNNDLRKMFANPASPEMQAPARRASNG